MMKKFLLVVCGSFVGAFLALLFTIIGSMIMAFSIASSMRASTSGKSVEKNSILYVNLEGEVTERALFKNPFTGMMPSMMGGDNGASMSLATFKQAMKNAAENKNIACVYLDCRGVVAAPATLYEMRKALVDFKRSKKKIYAYGDEGISQSDYYLASVADSIFLNPYGAVDLHGFGSSIPYFKTLLDKVGVEMQIVRVGKYKSAVEPYFLDEMSAENREQIETYIGNIWNCMADSIAKSRTLTLAQLNSLTDSLPMFMTADSLKTLKLVDNLCYRTQFEDKLRKLTKLKDDEDLKIVTPSDLVTDETVMVDEGSDEVAVLYACGEIDGDASPMRGDGIDSEALADEIRELRLNDDVKALVLRVNSPGGSAFGSEVIWNALDEFKKAGKPFVVSMGDYAASGGYYISCGADRIFAEPITITGSIGVFGMIPNVQTVVENKIGVHMNTVKTHENTDFGSILHPLTPYQRERLQSSVNRTYDLFTSRCATGRNVSQDSIKEIGGGRVWDGISAMGNGLIDEYGGIDEAVKWVAKKAGLKEGKYSVKAHPMVEDSFMAMLEQMQNTAAEQRMAAEMGIFYDYYRELQAIMARRHVLCLMPEQYLF